VGATSAPLDTDSRNYVSCSIITSKEIYATCFKVFFLDDKTRTWWFHEIYLASGMKVITNESSESGTLSLV